MKEKRNDLNNNDDDGDVEGSDNLDDKECERLMKSGLQALPLTATDQLMPCRMDVTEDYETKETIVGLKPSSMAGVKDHYDQEKENIDAAYLTQTTFDSVFSPVVRSHARVHSGNFVSLYYSQHHSVKLLLDHTTCILSSNQPHTIKLA